MVLELARRRAKGVADGDEDVLVRVVGGGVATHDQLAAGHRDGNAHVEQVPLVMAPVRRLDSNLRADVAIIGGGFVGLWTALALREQEPGIRIAVLEGGRCGGGASGLNGGFVMSWWPKIASLVGICGVEDALWLADETTRSVAALGPFLEKHGIDAEYRQSGWLWTATAAAHLGAWDSVVETAQRWANDELADARLRHAADLALEQAGRAGLTDPARLTKLAAWFDAANRTRDLLRTTVRGDLAMVELLLAWAGGDRGRAVGARR